MAKTVLPAYINSDQLASRKPTPPGLTAEEAGRLTIRISLKLGILSDNGKQYNREPARPRQRRQRPLTDGFRHADRELEKVIGRIERLVTDDRFARNRDAVAFHANTLIRMRVLDVIISKMVDRVPS